LSPVGLKKKSKKSRLSKKGLLLDTAVVRYLVPGLYDSRFRQVVDGYLGERPRAITFFVRMEFLRGAVVPLAKYYFVIKRFPTLQLGLDYLSQEFATGKNKLLVQTARHWLAGQQGSSKAAALRRFGSKIVGLARAFDSLPGLERDADGVNCQLGRIDVPPAPFREETLLAFCVRWDAFRKDPKCSLCDFRSRQTQTLPKRGAELCGREAQAKYNRNKQFLKQAKNLNQARATTTRKPSCWWCDILGDSIIALDAHPQRTIVSSDLSFEPLCQLLGKKHQCIPSARKILETLRNPGGQIGLKSSFCPIRVRNGTFVPVRLGSRCKIWRQHKRWRPCRSDRTVPPLSGMP
jgi:hypothetical protein